MVSNMKEEWKDILGYESYYQVSSTRDAERQTGIFHNSISRCCNLLQSTAGGFYWKYVEEVA